MRLQKTTCAILLGISLLGDVATAGDRRFTYVYETTTGAKGEIEVENFATWKTRREGSGRVNEFDFRHEIEYGVTDRLQAGIYVADWKVADGQAIYKDTAVELIYNMTNPVTDLLGSALYGEVKLGDQLFKLEGKLLLQKNFGPIVLAYNAGIEAEWEGARFGNYDERSGEFMESFGVSYQFSPHFLLGGEFLHELGFDEWQEAGDPVIYAGPNASFRFDRYFVTTTAMVQVTAVTDEADFQWRAIFGMHF
jgi:hypothetical protein